MQRATTRRQFLEDSILAAAAAAAATPKIFAAEERSSSANDKVTVAIFGCGIRGKQHAQELERLPGCEIAYVCDPDRDRAAELASQIAKKGARQPQAVQDLRKVLDDKSVQAVFIATPNHWHALAAIWAMQAGKDVYVEKPVSHNISEGRRIVQTAQKHGRICQGGTQNRSNAALMEALKYMKEGKLGDVRLAKSIVYGRRDSIGGPGHYQVPANVDYNLFCGPAPMSELTRPNFHYDWHWFWETGNGELGNNNIHSTDICRWGLGVSGLGKRVLSYGGRLGYLDAGQTPNTQVVIHDFGGKMIITETRGLPTPTYKPTGKGGGWVFYGSKGIIAGESLFDLDGNLLNTFTGKSESHFGNFLNAVRSRKQSDLHAPVIETHQSTALCHVGNISYRLGKTASLKDIATALDDFKDESVTETFERTRSHIKDNEVDLDKTPVRLGEFLGMEPGKEAFKSNAQANAFLTREYRKPFVVPSEREI